MTIKEIGPVSELPAGTVIAVGGFAVGNTGDELFAVSRRCRHLNADLAKGSIDRSGCLVCPWHGAKFDVESGKMVRGPQGIFAKIPGLGTAFKALTLVMPLRRKRVTEKDGTVYLE